MHRKKRQQQVLMLLIAITWLALAGTVKPIRSQDLICCDILFIDSDGNWFGARRDCKAALQELSAASRTKACAKIRQWKPAEPAPWFKPFSASRSGCCSEAAEVCGDPSLACTTTPDRANRPKLPNKSPCEAGDANVTPTITIDLADTLNIDESPEMPSITATANVTPASTDVSWSAQITYKAPSGCSGGPQFNSPTITGEGETFTPDFGAIYGGKLEITATTKCGTGAKTTITRNVGGLNADAAEVRSEIGTMESPFEADDLQKIACHESRQRQFRAGNTPTFGPAGDAGIMQICYRRTAGDIWNWKTNIATGRANLLEKVGFSRGVPRTVRRRSVRGQGPFPNATDFTSAQLRLEAIKRYNAGNEPDVGYWEWDDSAGAWVGHPQLGGDPNYVAHVVEQNANCP